MTIRGFLSEPIGFPAETKLLASLESLVTPETIEVPNSTQTRGNNGRITVLSWPTPSPWEKRPRPRPVRVRFFGLYRAVRVRSVSGPRPLPFLPARAGFAAAVSSGLCVIPCCRFCYWHVGPGRTRAPGVLWPPGSFRKPAGLLQVLGWEPQQITCFREAAPTPFGHAWPLRVCPPPPGAPGGSRSRNLGQLAAPLGAAAAPPASPAGAPAATPAPGRGRTPEQGGPALAAKQHCPTPKRRGLPPVRPEPTTFLARGITDFL
eukprot:gene22291-biopygen22232